MRRRVERVGVRSRRRGILGGCGPRGQCDCASGRSGRLGCRVVLQQVLCRRRQVGRAGRVRGRRVRLRHVATVLLLLGRRYLAVMLLMLLKVLLMVMLRMLLVMVMLLAVD